MQLRAPAPATTAQRVVRRLLVGKIFPRRQRLCARTFEPSIHHSDLSIAPRDASRVVEQHPVEDRSVVQVVPTGHGRRRQKRIEERPFRIKQLMTAVRHGSHSSGKAIAIPTDNRLLMCVAGHKLVLIAKRAGLALRQTSENEGRSLKRLAGG